MKLEQIWKCVEWKWGTPLWVLLKLALFLGHLKLGMIPCQTKSNCLNLQVRKKIVWAKDMSTENHAEMTSANYPYHSIRNEVQILCHIFILSFIHIHIHIYYICIILSETLTTLLVSISI